MQEKDEFLLTVRILTKFALYIYETTHQRNTETQVTFDRINVANKILVRGDRVGAS